MRIEIQVFQLKKKRYKKRYKIFYKNECLTLSRLRKHLKRKLIKDAQGVFFFFFESDVQGV